MSLTESATKEKLASGFVVSLEEGDVQAGYPLPIGGTHQHGEGINFVLFSRHATLVRLEFYNHPPRTISLNLAKSLSYRGKTVFDSNLDQAQFC